MAAGRPRGPNDPSLISSLETAVRRVRRPGPIGLAWNWRVEFAILVAIAGLSLLIADSIGLIGLAAAAGAGLPIIWSVTPVDYGERVRLWCPAGITAADLITAREILAAACWATEVRVSPGDGLEDTDERDPYRWRHPPDRLSPADETA